MLKVIREILRLLWKVLRIYVRKLILQFLAKALLYGFVLAILVTVVGFVLMRC